MAMALGPRPDDGELMLDINTTPLIDVMLVLLIMLIVTIPARTDAVKLDLPQAAPPPATNPVIVALDIAADGTMRWNGTALPDRAALESALTAAAQQAPQPEIHLDPDGRVRFASVAMVLAEAQRRGVTSIGLVSAER
ncbi:MAG TPA: biopolymer transporter ExbD [Stellaceae bacterium]|jgi:biopolymer transport protein ExbD|nr:biopolymer transporter ExbD [Stellaceae bacterium]